jgi:UDP:flavonoid glycosyltransferase YjiC (YdhE family)
MKILLVTRGSQGDTFPYLRLALELKNRGHSVTINLPSEFEKEGKNIGVRVVPQNSDDIHGMLEETPGTKNLLAWTTRVIDSQFKELIPLLNEHDIMIASNTEFAAGSIAEYCGKPLIRTAYAPLIPSRTIPPPVFPLTKPNLLIRPVLLWGILNIGLNLMVKKTLNKHRKVLSMIPIKDQAEHAPATAFNYLTYSKYLGTVDNKWKYEWKAGGYCFNDLLSYDKEELEKITGFINADRRPTVFFSLGSCYIEGGDRFAEMLLDICTAHNYKLLVACGWWHVGAHLQKRENLYRMDCIIPHCLIFPQCDAIIHHGGAGTSHSAARSGRPQMGVPLLLDQFYWSSRIKELGLGPEHVKIKSVSRKQLEHKVIDLVTNPFYKEKANSMGILIRGEEGLENFCRHIESYQSQIQNSEEREMA